MLEVANESGVAGCGQGGERGEGHSVEGGVPQRQAGEECSGKQLARELTCVIK